MNKEQETSISRASTYFRFFSEKYLWGSTRSELHPDERAVWIDFLCLASMNFGVIEVYSRDQLAQQLLISRELLDRSIEKFIKFGKIKRKYYKKEKKEVFTVVKWSHFQADYLTKKVKKSTIYEKKERSEKTGKSDAENQPILQERKGEEKRIDNIKGEERIDETNYFPSHPRDQFLHILREFSKEYPYPFNKKADGQIFDYSIEKHRNVDPIGELEKKIDYWKKNPGALKSTGKSPRQQLLDFFEKEAEYQKGS